MKTSYYLLLICSTILFSSCKKENSKDDVSTYPYYFIGTVNGTTVKLEADDLNSAYGCGISQPESSLGYDDYDIYEGTVLEHMTDPSKPYIYVHILKYFNHEPSQAEKTAMINTGSYGYGRSETSSSTVNGASIDYYDANGEGWYSETGPQTGSTFTITDVSANAYGTSGKIFKANFSCKLYSIDGTRSIQITNAVIRGKVLSP